MQNIVLKMEKFMMMTIWKIETVGEPGSGDRLRHFSESAVGVGNPSTFLSFDMMIDLIYSMLMYVSVIGCFPNPATSQDLVFFTKYLLYYAGGGKRRRATFSSELRQLRRRWFLIINFILWPGKKVGIK